MNKKIYAEEIVNAGFRLPDNWGKLSTSRAEAERDRLLGVKSPKVGLAKAIGTMAGTVLGMAAAALGNAVTSVAATAKEYNDGPSEKRAQTKAATMPKNPNWGRSEKTLGKTQFYPVRRLAADPEPMTRQVRRQNERRAVKMPIGARQSIWHEVMGYGKINAKRA